MISLLRHISFRLWAALLLGAAVSFAVLPLIQAQIGLEWNLMAVAAVLLFFYFGTGWVLNRWALAAVNQLMAEAASYERDGMYLEAEDAFQRALTFFDSFMISPLVKRKASGALGARMARFYLAGPGRDETSQEFLISYLQNNPHDEEVAEHWLQRMENRGGLKEEHQELASQIGAVQPQNKYIQEVLARYYLLIERADYTALQTYRRAYDGEDPLSAGFVQNLARVFLTEKRVDEWALEVYLRAMEHGGDQAGYIRGLAACVNWIPESKRNRHLLQAAQKHLADIDGKVLERMHAGFSAPVPPSAVKGLKTRPGTGIGAIAGAAIRTVYLVPISFVRWAARMSRYAVGIVKQSRKVRRILTGIVLAGLVAAIGGLVVNTVGHLVVSEKDADRKTESSAAVVTDPFTLQVAAYVKRDHAQRFVDQLSKQGLDAYWTEAVRDQKRWYQVRLSHFPDKKAAREYGETLKSKGIIEDYYVANYRRP